MKRQKRVENQPFLISSIIEYNNAPNTIISMIRTNQNSFALFSYSEYNRICNIAKGNIITQTNPLKIDDNVFMSM